MSGRPSNENGSSARGPRARSRSTRQGSDRFGRAGYHPLSEYGVIGDLHTVALVASDGSIDWYCTPSFDSPSVFAAILDHRIGGLFQICATEKASHRQLYLPDTNILITRFLSRQGVGEVTDFMPIRGEGTSPLLHGIVRRVSVVRGEIDFRVECQPAFDYARAPHEVRPSAGGVTFRGPGLALGLSTRHPLSVTGGGVRTEIHLREGESTTFVLENLRPEVPNRPRAFSEKLIESALEETTRFWRDWVSKSNYRGRWREMVYRSALVLKLLTYAPTGAIVAAPTNSLPEAIGAARNWDYRYSWIRDSAFTAYAFLRLGFVEETRAFMRWLLARASDLEPEGSLHPVYRIDGGHDLREERLDHLEGYRGSRPVRLGNGAVDQFQLDLYGALMDAVYLLNKHGWPISHDLWSSLRRMLNWLAENWQRPDQGIWEVRSGPRRFVYSAVMCWVAFDRAIRVARNRGFPGEIDSWRKARDAIYEWVMSEGWDEARGAFVQHSGSRALDASALVMPLVFFVSPHDPRMLRTLDAIESTLVFDNLVRRYSLEETHDGLSGSEGTFSLCSFWLVEALTRAGRLEDARVLFEKMLGYANHVGLFSEEVGLTGEALGNFPQALTHLALVSAAVNLDRALGSQG
jgi:GH15 family glucan-1,4-alpha-glucosidase